MGKGKWDGPQGPTWIKGVRSRRTLYVRPRRKCVDIDKNECNAMRPGMNVIIPVIDLAVCTPVVMRSARAAVLVSPCSDIIPVLALDPCVEELLNIVQVLLAAGSAQYFSLGHSQMPAIVHADS